MRRVGQCGRGIRYPFLGSLGPGADGNRVRRKLGEASVQRLDLRSQDHVVVAGRVIQVVANRETAIGPDRAQLGFATAASEEFGFLLDLGFRLAELSDTLACYQTERRLVRVFHGRGSYELGVEVGRWIEIDGVSREQAFSLHDVVALRNDPADVGFGGTSATSAASVRSFLGRLAGWTREFALPLLVDGDDLFDQLSAHNAARADAEREELRASQLRSRADEGWRRRISTPWCGHTLRSTADSSRSRCEAQSERGSSKHESTARWATETSTRQP